MTASCSAILFDAHIAFSRPRANGESSLRTPPAEKERENPRKSFFEEKSYSRCVYTWAAEKAERKKLLTQRFFSFFSLSPPGVR